MSRLHRFYKPVLTGIAIIGVGGAVYVGRTVHQSPSSSYSPTIYLAADGSDLNSGTSYNSPVRTASRAYQLLSSSCTQNVEMEDSSAHGTFPSQWISYTLAKSCSGHCDPMANNTPENRTEDYSQCMTFFPEPGKTVKMTGWGPEVPNIRLDGVDKSRLVFDKSDPVAPYTYTYCQLLNQYPPPGLTVIVHGSIANGSKAATLDSTAGLKVGDPVQVTALNRILPDYSDNLPPEEIASITDATHMVLTQAAVGTMASNNFVISTGRVTLPATLTNGSTSATMLSADLSQVAMSQNVSVNAISTNQARQVGVSGTGIQSGTTIVDAPDGTHITLSQAATVSGSQTLTFQIGCKYPNADVVLGAGPRVNGVTCYGLGATQGLPETLGHDDIAQNFTSNGLPGFHAAHDGILHADFTNYGDVYEPQAGTWHLNGCQHGGATAPSNHNVFYDARVTDRVETIRPNPCSDTAPPRCTTGFMSNHAAALHFEGGSYNLIDRTYWDNNAGHHIEYEPEDGYPTSAGNIIQNTVFGVLNAAQGGQFDIFCHSSGTGFSTGPITARFDTYLFGQIVQPNKDNPSCVWNGEILNYGNVVVGASLSSSACTAATTSPLKLEYTFWQSAGTGGSCAATNAISASLVASTTAPYDVRLVSGSSAINAVPCGTGVRSCPTENYYGEPRSGSFTNAGAG